MDVRHRVVPVVVAGKEVVVDGGGGGGSDADSAAGTGPPKGDQDSEWTIGET